MNDVASNNNAKAIAALALLFLSMTMTTLPARGISISNDALLAGDTSGWQVEGGWIERTGDLIASKPGSATYELYCNEGPLTFSFVLRHLSQSIDINLIADDENFYNINFLNQTDAPVYASLTRRAAGSEDIAPVSMDNFSYYPNDEYLITITLDAGNISVKVHQLITGEFAVKKEVIKYTDSNPYHIRRIAFRNPDGSIFRAGNIIINCSSTYPEYDQPVDLGPLTYKRPEKKDLIDTEKYGIVPANQVNVVISENAPNPSQTAEDLARELGGEVVGSFKYINLFQIETKSKTLEQLEQDIATAGNFNLIDLAFPTQQIYLEESSKKWPLEDRIYKEGNRKRGYEIVGVQNAWDTLDNLTYPLRQVYVGVTDDGLYRGFREFDGVVEINDSIGQSHLSQTCRDFPNVGSHGTGVMNILAADPNNGNLTGIASKALGSRLQVMMINIFKEGVAWNWDSYYGLKNEIMSGCTILSCSWGSSNSTRENAMAFYLFFKKIYEDNSGILFVCSAGNDRKKGKGTERVPNGYFEGYSLPNMITVGNIWNNGSVEATCNVQNSGKSDFEVTLAAPGQEAVWGYNPNKDIWTNSGGGSSMATPHVTSAAAMIRSINPCLDAGQIKNILVRNGANNVSGVDAPREIGGCILSIDASVREAIRIRNQTKCLPRTADIYVPPIDIDDELVIRNTPTPGNEPLKVVSFTFTPNPVCAGDTTRMNWNTTGAIGVTIVPGIGAAEPCGFRIITPKQTMGYTIRAWNESGNTDQIMVLLRLEQCIVAGAASTGKASVIFDFVKEAHDQGQWQGGAKDSIFRFGERSEDDGRGSAMWKDNCLLSDMSIADRVILVRPPEHGYITGTYRYMNYVVQDGDHLAGRIGFARGAKNGNATFGIYLIDDKIERLLFQRTLSYSEGPFSFDIPMGDFVGSQPAISLAVNSDGSSGQDVCIWQDVKITGSTNRPALKAESKKADYESMASHIFDSWKPGKMSDDEPEGSNVDWLRT